MLFGVKKFLWLTNVLALLSSNTKELAEKPELQAPLKVAFCLIVVSVELKGCFQAAKRWAAGPHIVQTRQSGVSWVSRCPCNELVATGEGDRTTVRLHLIMVYRSHQGVI